MHFGCIEVTVPPQTCHPERSGVEGSAVVLLFAFFFSRSPVARNIESHI
jgi:hypothetical protein